MSKFDDIITSYCGGLLTEEDPAVGAPPVDPAAAPAEAPVDATLPVPDQNSAPMTPEGRIQMLDMVRKAMLISPTELKEHEKMDLGMATTHENVENIKTLISKIFTRLEGSGTTDLSSEGPEADEEY